VDTYFVEEFTHSERQVLSRFFTNIDKPVYAVINLPDLVKGALFARYSRSAKSIRRLFLDEFVGELDGADASSVDSTVGFDRAAQLYERVFVEYGDDSVAQLCGVHIACEQASNLLTKVLEWGRLASYMEQSTRYIAYDGITEGRYRYYRDPDVLGSELGGRYTTDLDAIFGAYSKLVPVVLDHVRTTNPKSDSDSSFVYNSATKAKALDAVRGMLPAAAVSNVGMYGSAQAYEQMLLRMRAHPLPEARVYADLILGELRKVIPTFVRRVDMADRGEVTSNYMATNQTAMSELSAELLGSEDEPDHEAGVDLVDFDPRAEIKIVASMLYPYTNRSEAEIERMVDKMSTEERIRVIKTYTGDRSNRRHRPGRALERVFYRFDVLADYGAFRDIQRHRMATIEWQTLNPNHGYVRPALIDDANVVHAFESAMERSAGLYEALRGAFPTQAAYAVSLAYRIRFNMNINARAAMHTLELRTTPQGHEAYRTVAQQMHKQIADVAGHHAIAAMMNFVDHSTQADLERLESEKRSELRRASGNT